MTEQKKLIEVMEEASDGAAYGDRRGDAIKDDTRAWAIEWIKNCDGYCKKHKRIHEWYYNEETTCPEHANSNCKCGNGDLTVISFLMEQLKIEESEL